MRASSTMTRRVIVVPPELPLRDAWAVMRAERIRHLPVVQAGALLGMLSDRDVLLRSRLEGDAVVAPGTPVGEAMTPAPYVAQTDSDVAELVRVMTARKIDAMPVVDGRDRLTGLVTSTDLMLLLLRQDEARPLPFDFEIEEHGLAAMA